jgi:hypothetical protein
MPIAISSNFTKGDMKIFEFTVKGDPEFISPIFQKIIDAWRKTGDDSDIQIIEERNSVSVKLTILEDNEETGKNFIDFFSNTYEILKM